VSFEEEWVHLNVPGEANHSGFGNFATSFKYQFVRDVNRELATSLALDIDWGGTGAKSVGAEPFTTLTPTLLAGKGFGFLPENLRLLRPLAVTGELGYSLPTQSSTTEFEEGGRTETHNPEFLIWGGSLQYSMPYLKERVGDLGLPKFIKRLIFITEFNLQTQTSNFNGEERTTGTINPGVIYMTDKYQICVEAIMPVNRASGEDVGIVGNVHFFLEDILPHSLGKPLFALEHPGH